MTYNRDQDEYSYSSWCVGDFLLGNGTHLQEIEENQWQLKDHIQSVVNACPTRGYTASVCSIDNTFGYKTYCMKMTHVLKTDL